MSAERRKKRSPKACAKELQIEQRREKAAELRLAGHSIREIARALDVGIATIHSDIEAVLERTRDASGDAIEKDRRLSLARIDVAIKGLWESVKTGNHDSVRELVRLEQRRAKLLGLDAADKHEVSGPGGSSIPLDVTAKASLALKLDELRARLTSAAGNRDGEPGGDPGSQSGAG
jgi:DNA-binding CsgD family transcriptional regulator